MIRMRVKYTDYPFSTSATLFSMLGGALSKLCYFPGTIAFGLAVITFATSGFKLNKENSEFLLHSFIACVVGVVLGISIKFLFNKIAEVIAHHKLKKITQENKHDI